MDTPVLWHFRFSHYNEKVRWALDWKAIPHRRRALVPGLHIPRMLLMTGQKRVPVLVVGGKAVTDSTAIIAFLEAQRPLPPLYPAAPEARARALALEEFFDEELGPHLRRALFHDILPDADWSAAAMTTGFGPAVRATYRALFPATRAVMRMDMRIDATGAALGRRKVVAALDRIEQELGPSGYLVGGEFSVADLTAAALLCPLTQPPEYPYPFPGPLPEPAASFGASLAERPGFRWALEMYRRHRGRSAEVAAEGSSRPAARPA
jgi:glutathione S-transferase